MDKNKVNYISFINVIASFSVVLLHADSSFWHYTKDASWAVSNVIDSVFYFAVPAFFMLSGATLIDYSHRYSTKEYFKKRFFKTVIPFLAWSLFAMLWQSRKTLWAIITGTPNKGTGWTIGSVIDGIINTKFLDIYWFFIPLFCIYLIIPLLSAVSEKKRVKIFTYIAVVLAVLSCAVPFILRLLERFAAFKIGDPFVLYLGERSFLIYPLIGYVLHKRALGLKSRLVIYAAALVGLLTQLVGTYCLTTEQGFVSYMYFKGYFNLPCLLYATGIFLFLKNAAERIKSERINRFFTYFQGFTFPIYLIHRYFLDVFEENLHYIHLKTNSLLYIVGATVLAIALSVLTAMLLRKIPVLRHIVP